MIGMVFTRVTCRMLTLLKKSSPIDRPKKQTRLAALHAIGSMRLTILYPQNRVLEVCPGTFSTTSLVRAVSRLVSTLVFGDASYQQAPRRSLQTLGKDHADRYPTPHNRR